MHFENETNVCTINLRTSLESIWIEVQEDPNCRVEIFNEVRIKDRSGNWVSHPSLLRDGSSVSCFPRQGGGRGEEKRGTCMKEGEKEDGKIGSGISKLCHSTASRPVKLARTFQILSLSLSLSFCSRFFNESSCSRNIRLVCFEVALPRDNSHF